MSDEQRHKFVSNPRNVFVELEMDFSKTPPVPLNESIRFTCIPLDSIVNEVEILATVRRWEFPKDPFIIYEPRDEGYCRRLGIGREVEVELKVEFPRATLRRNRDALVIQTERANLFDTLSEIVV